MSAEHQHCWKYFKCQLHFYALFVQCRPGFHIISIKKHSYTLFRLKSEGRETMKLRKQEKKDSSSPFYSQETSCLKNQLEGEPQLLLKIYCQKQIAIMTQCIKN